MTRKDPFTAARDPGEARADHVIRELLLDERQPGVVYRQTGTGSGYALIAPHRSGEVLLTVPGLHEANFMYHGQPGTTGKELAEFIAACVRDAGADSVRLPMLTGPQGRALVSDLTLRLPDWRLDSLLASISPVHRPARKRKKFRKSLRRAILRARNEGFRIELEPSLPFGEIRNLHFQRWGRNRDDAFFRMLAALLEAGCAELATARTREGDLVAAALDILGTHIRHGYYGVSDPEKAPGTGTAVMGVLWGRFVDDEQCHVYSLGRGAERYKYQFATHFVEHFELRGYFAPRPPLEPFHWSQPAP